MNSKLSSPASIKAPEAEIDHDTDALTKRPFPNDRREEGQTLSHGKCPIHNGQPENGQPPPHGSLLQRALTLTLDQIAEADIDEAHLLFCKLAEEGAGGGVNWGDRWEEVKREFKRKGSYVKSRLELTLAAQIAWRNSIRCIGRKPWRSLKVLDMRLLSTCDDIFEALLEHLKYATNGGSILPAMSVFSRDQVNGCWVKILNQQLIRYAGYRDRNGMVLGDPQNAALTETAIECGWQPPHQRTAFDLLPILIKDQNSKIRVYELPRCPEIVLEVPIQHPAFAWFESLHLRWYAVPSICNMVLDAGGLRYPLTVFNGWYMGTEIASRNLADESRYNVLPRIGQMMGLQLGTDRSLWRDRALVELNAAVLYSFAAHGVRVVDHHLASKQFMEFVEREAREGRQVCGDWSWLVPPLSGSASPIYHRYYSENIEKPGLFYRE
jgi:nitric-oxide synthase, bacterial